MLYWIPYAFVRFTLSFAAGIVLAILFPDVIRVQTAMGALCICTTLFFVLALLRKTRINAGPAGLMAIFICGYLNAIWYDESRRDDHLLHYSVAGYYGTFVTTPQEKEKSFKQILKISACFHNGEWRPASGRVLVYYAKDGNPFRYGDQLLVRGRPPRVAGPSNPGEFDYRRFLALRNIHFQHYLRREDVVYAGYDPQNTLMKLMLDIRSWSGARLDSAITGKHEKAIASALVLGITDGLDDEITQAYAATGSMHVLAVSGLHVGIIYLALSLLLKPLRRKKAGKWMVAIVSIIVLWSYACITGLSPSVLRAVTMFSFVALGQPMNHRTNIYNTLAASAFFLLLFNPTLILSVGFQLSYLAVTGIVYLQPLLYQSYEPSSRIVDEVWRISSVSIAAQLSTFSIGIFYFNQFPNYFLVTNLFVIPLAFAILCGGISVLVFDGVPWLGDTLGWLLSKIISILNFLIFQVESLPYAVSGPWSISVLQCIALMALVVFLTLFVQYRKSWALMVSLVALLIVGAEQWIAFNRSGFQSRLTIYKISGVSAWEIHSGARAYPVYDSVLHADRGKFRFHILPNRVRMGISPVETRFPEESIKGIRGINLVSWNSRTILQLTSVSLLPDSLSVDFLILSHGTAGEMGRILEKINAGKIILDTSNSYFVADKALNSLANAGRIHSVWHHGAFEADL